MPIGILALSLAAFAIGTGEFIISGILPNLAQDFAVSIPTAGLLVTGYAAAVAIGGPLLALFTTHLPRKPLIVSLLILFALGQALCAMAPSFAWLMAGRVFTACSHGLFFGTGGVAALSLVSPAKRGMAMAMFLGGITVANVMGVPAGAAIGNSLGWRWTFWAVGACGLAASALVARWLPPDETSDAPAPSLSAQFGALQHHQVYLSFLVIVLVMIGSLAMATYQVPAMILVAGVPQDATPIYLVMSGFGAIAGIYAGGRAADWRLMPSMLTILIAQILAAALLMWWMPSPLGMGAGLFLGTLANWALNAPVQSRILGAARAAPHLASTLISTAYNIGIALGAWVGGLWIDGGLGYRGLPTIGVLCCAAAAGVAAASWRLDRVS